MKLLRAVAATSALALLTGIGLTAPAHAAPAPRTGGDTATLRGYAADTWRSMTAMADPSTGLVSDNIEGDLSPGSRSAYTSPTNIGAYLWSTVAARDLHIIGGREAMARMKQTLDTLGTLHRDAASGMFFNWYDPHSGAVLRTWPVDGSTITPFLSSVDNGWLAAALMTVRTAEPGLAKEANALLAPMDFGFYYDKNARPGVGGELAGGFYEEKPPGCSVLGNYRNRGPDVYYTCNHYDVLNSEPRIASYIGMALGQIPLTHYFTLFRTFPPDCSLYQWQQMQPVGYNHTYMGVNVYEGAYRYEGLQFVPTWGGDMFEALMPDMFVPEETWGPTSWGINDPAYVQGQIRHGLDEAKYGYWGFSPSSDPKIKDGYTAFGVPSLGMDQGGYPSDEEQTVDDPGIPGCRPAGPAPKWGDGVVTPHASFLALKFAPKAAVDNLAKLKANFDSYGRGGFYDAVAVRSGTVAKRYLSLDQGMTLGALGNFLAHDDIRSAFDRGPVQRVIAPLLRIERFNAKPVD